MICILERNLWSVELLTTTEIHDSISIKIESILNDEDRLNLF